MGPTHWPHRFLMLTTLIVQSLVFKSITAGSSGIYAWPTGWPGDLNIYIYNVKSTISLQNTVAAVGFCLYVILNKYSYRKLVFKKYEMFCVPLPSFP